MKEFASELRAISIGGIIGEGQSSSPQDNHAVAQYYHAMAWWIMHELGERGWEPFAFHAIGEPLYDDFYHFRLEA